jgi:hypothetical protein
MASVTLKRDFFGPDGTLYLVRNNPHSFPADWDLPASAVTAAADDPPDEDDGPAVPAKPPVPLKKP